MNTKRSSKRPGLILLVVLGMLALFSMLSITYVVFASQSRATSVALSRKDVRGNQSYKPLFEEAIMQLVRGSTDPNDATYHHSLLGDLYGDIESTTPPSPPIPAARQGTFLTIRDWQYDPSTFATPQMTYDSAQRAMLLAPSVDNAGNVTANGHFLRIPLAPAPRPANATQSQAQYLNPTILPPEHDALTGRIVTFPNGNGPLSGHSFRIVRYIGRIDPGATPTPTPEEFAQNYSIVIDLLDVDLSQTYSTFDPGTSRLTTLSLAEWVNAFPPVSGSGLWQSGVYACYGTVDITSGLRHLSNGYNLLLNARPLNSHGIGMRNNAVSQTHSLPQAAGSNLDNIATGLMPNYRMIPGALIGDSDEPYDAPDYANFFLSYREPDNMGGTNQVIPSFHRAALVNYIVNREDPASYTPQLLLAALQRIESVCGRPLSINVTTPVGSYVRHPSFTGSNVGAAMRTPQLNFSITGNWNTEWPTIGLPAFQQWVNWLVLGPWDVDNDADGFADSMWVDVGLPLQTSPDGQLLKAMVAYYVEDLDSKLDVNATASYAQVDSHYPAGFSYTSPVNGEFARFTGGTTYLTQGVGYGPAETSFRHLFAKGPRFNPPYVTAPQAPIAQQAAFRQFLESRYRRNASYLDRSPGFVGDDAASQLRMREQRNVFAHGVLPGLPLGTHGRMAMGLDVLGNPRVMNVDTLWGQGVEDPYEARWVHPSFQDSPISISEWERIYRIGDGDRTALPQRLEDLFGEVSDSVAFSNLRREITPRSSYLRVPYMATRGKAGSFIPSSFLEMVNTILELRDLNEIPLDADVNRVFASLFPLEFQRGLPLDLNRPLGNGIDDNGDGQVDEPMELFNFTQNPIHTTSQSAIGTLAGVVENYTQGQQNFDPSIDANSPPSPPTPAVYRNNLESRQLLARHLYCLAQLIIPQDYVFPNGDPSIVYASPPTRLSQAAVKERARILAQWAVNVVDFRDADSAMTRFPYDEDPLNLREPISTPPPAFMWDPTEVVWGMEQPELLITESLATHDIRIKRDTSTAMPRYDQYRIPEGSLFLEFFCPRSTSLNNGQNAAGVSPALYNPEYSPSPPLPPLPAPTAAGARTFLDLTRMAPSNGPMMPEVPVWRVYIGGPRQPPVPPSTSPPPTLLEVYNDPVRKHALTLQSPVSNYRFDGSATPPQTSIDAAAASGMDFDRTMPQPGVIEPVPEPDPTEARILVFASGSGFVPTLLNSPGVVDPDSQVFVSEIGNVQLEGGQYLVAGPRDVTYFGSKLSAWNGGNPENRPNNHRIELNPGWAQMYKIDATDPNYTIAQRATMRNCFTMIASSARPSSWAADTSVKDRIGLNVSEPLGNEYYDKPEMRISSTDTSTDPENGASGFANILMDGYYDYSTAPPPPAKPAFDNGAKGPLQYWRVGSPDGQNMTTGAVNVGTQEDWCTAYLQRLADPEKPWDATFNPYITVDWIPIDLTVFSGEENHSDVYPAPPTPPAPPPPGSIKFGSRQKTGHPLVATPTTPPLRNEVVFTYNPTSTTTGTTFYSAATHSPRTPSSTSGLGQTFFDYELHMDDTTSTRPTAVTISPARNDTTLNTLGFLNSTYRIAGEGAPATSSIPGMPADPNGTANNWVPDALYWPNRQFANTYELANVPTTSPGQFMQEFSAEIPGTAGNDRYAIKTDANSFTPFAHLLSFFREQDADPASTSDAGKDVPMSAIFDFVETASPWSDANEFEDPRNLAPRNPSSVSPAGYAAVVASTNTALSTLRAPYNRLSQYVEPGRINLNTVAQQNVIQGLWFNALPPAERTVLGGTTVSNVWKNIYESRRGYTPSVGVFDYSLSPERFDPAQPTQFAGVFKPAMEAGFVPMSANDPAPAYPEPAQATLLREDVMNSAGQPLIRDVDSFAQKNAFTDSHPISRLVNLTSNRSNVFAVYVTVGFFYFNEGTGQLEQEYNADRGQAHRYKAFYVVDRSVPVGFQTGVDHNADRTILIRRYLKTDDQ